MPIPRYTPGSGNLGAAQPILDNLGSAWNQGAEAIEHPMVALRGMLGMDEKPVSYGADPAAVERANESFRHPAIDNPVVAPPRRRPMGKM